MMNLRKVLVAAAFAGGLFLPALSSQGAAPESAAVLPVQEQAAAADQVGGCDRPSPISDYKINYFALNTWPTNDKAQVKFQFSAKYKFLDRDWSLQGRSLSIYLAYSQKSLWNVGKESMPFEESNYNPEAFINYHWNKSWGHLSVRDLIVSPYEHESNGMEGPASRSWNRAYFAVRVGYLPLRRPCPGNEDEKDRVELRLKVWHAYGYGEQDVYLRARGSNRTFLDYEGYGEAGIVLRDMLVWGNRIYATSKLGGLKNVELQYQQKLPHFNFVPYFQYWYGYNETLLRFDQFAKRTFFGVSFEY